MLNILEQFNGKKAKGTFFLKAELGELITVSNWTAINAAIETVLSSNNVNTTPLITINVKFRNELDLMISASEKSDNPLGVISLKLINQNYEDLLVLKEPEFQF